MPGQGVVVRYVQAQAIFEHGLERQPLGRPGLHTQAEIHFLLQHQRIDALGHHVTQPHLDAGEAFAKALHHAWQQPRAQ